MEPDALESRLHELREKARDLANIAATRRNLEEAKRAVLALAMKTAEKNGHKAVSAQEREAYASAEYQTWLNGYTEAVREHERLRLEWEVMRIRFEAWRTLEATRRAELMAT